MALQASGQPISFGDIINEFGVPPNRNLGAYRVSETYGKLSNLPLDTGIPQSDSIRFSNFYNKRLNIIVNLWSGDNEFRVNARQKYNDKNVNVVGKFLERPNNSSGKKVLIYVNKFIYSENNGNRSVSALRTGTWDLGTTLSVDVGEDGRILGAGGNGGRGSNNLTENGIAAQNGNSALGLEYSGVTVNVSSGAIISCGFGGGGGGGTTLGTSTGSGGKKGSGSSSIQTSGGGGGGGAGWPSGSGAPGGQSSYSGGGGSSGSLFSRGAGGAGGSGQVCSTVKTSIFKPPVTTCVTVTGGTGGTGGDSAVGPASGQNVSTFGGSNGSNGAAILYSQSYTLNNSGSVIGGQESGTVI
jgi:hypothetical protein